VIALGDAEVEALGEGGWVIRDGWLGSEVARAARDACARLAADARPAGVSAARVVDPRIRRDAILWLDPADPDPALAPVLAGFAALMAELNRAAWLGLTRFDLQLAAYPGDGAGYQRHRDALAGAQVRSPRRVTSIYYLNPDWVPEHGGELAIFGQRDVFSVSPIADRLLIFLSDRVDHEVRPAFAPRLALTAWFY
jgi:SM-20-related protein